MGLATYSAAVSFGLSLPPSGFGDCTEGMGEGVWCYPSYREQRPIPQSTKAESPHLRHFSKLNGTYSKLCRLQDAVGATQQLSGGPSAATLHRFKAC